MRRTSFLASLLFTAALCAQQPSVSCRKYTISATGRVEITTAPGLQTFEGSYTTTGTPASVSLTVEAGNDIPATQTPVTKVTAQTNTTGVNDLGPAKGAFAHWWVNVATLSGGTSPTILFWACFTPSDIGPSTVTVSGTVAATQSGTWTVQPGNTANTTPWLVTTVPGSSAQKTYYKSAALEASHAAIVTGAGTLYDVVAVDNTSAANLLVQCADSLTVPADGAVTPLVTFALGVAPNNAGWGQGPIAFSTGLSCWFSTATTTPFTKAVAAAVGIFQVTTK